MASEIYSTPAIFDPDARYVTSYLFSPTTLGFVRLLLGGYTLVTNVVILIWSGVVTFDAGEYFSFFTHLSYIGITAWFLASGIQCLAFVKSFKSEKTPRYPLQSWSRVFQILHEFLFSTIATFPIIVTVVYWALLADSGSFPDPYTSWSNISQHIINALFVLFELICTNLPTLRWIYLPTTIIILGLYLGVAYITYADQGFYPYDFLDPREQGALLAAYVAGIAIGQAIIFVIVRYVIILRIHLVGKKNPSPLENFRIGAKEDTSESRNSSNEFNQIRLKYETAEIQSM